jgi:hypothetical protein
VPGLIEFQDPLVDQWNFSPYVGMAWSPWQSRTVLRGSFGMWYDAFYWQSLSTQMFSPLARVATGTLSSTTSDFLASGGLTDPAMGSTNLTAQQRRAGMASFLNDYEMPYSMQWNFAVQQALWRNTTFEAKYMGNRGVHQPVFSQPNYMGVGPDTGLPVFFNSTPGQSELNQLTTTLSGLNNRTDAFALAGFNNPLTTVNFEGNSWYHGATAMLTHRFSGGFQMFANYTWSRWTTDSFGSPLDIGMPNRMQMWSLFDRRHQANVTAMFDVAPLFSDSWSVMRNVFADFTLSGSYNYSFGSQLIPVSGTDMSLGMNALATPAFSLGGNGTGVSGVTPLRNSAGQVVGYRANNPNARYITGAQGVFSGFNQDRIRLGDIHNVDVAAVKRFNVGEYASFELRGEAYNIFNRQQVTGTPLQSIGGGSLLPSTVVPGTIDVNNLEALTLFPSNARRLQLGLRLTF